jgi:hydrogenase maturation protein HypF
MAKMTKRLRLNVRGSVQGVGFRPFVYGLASDLGLAGFVRNEPRGVEIELEGADTAIDLFLSALTTSPPPLARIQAIRTEELIPRGEVSFVIRKSAQTGERTVFVAPDQATCEACLRELRDPNDRRYRYPFINCAHCGPRYTIIQDLPYDRGATTMAAFAMCPACRAEYENPANRRFHAEPTCCPVCGPQVELLDASGQRVCAREQALEAALAQLQAGKILAVKGLGGFHLACDAANAEAVRELRRRKQRDLKPFAVMPRDIHAAERFCKIDAEGRAALLAQERPIILLPKQSEHVLAEEVAPRSATFGVLLPYTPLHHLLLDGPFAALIMTSGNLSDEPIAFTNEDALARLAGLADGYLLHNRNIHIRTDDSVARVIVHKPRFLRRSRGYAPFPVALPADTAGNEILAVGAEMNNTIAVTRNGQAFLSHHIGDLDNLAAYESFLQAVGHFKNLLAVEPCVVACDLHPNYASTRFARQCGLPIMPVQHHHAHVASVLAEHGRTGKVIGVSFDGMGWGEDATAWGGEFMICDLGGFERVGRLEPVPQPGGDAAAKRPMRMGYVYLRRAMPEDADARARELMPAFEDAEMRLVNQIIARRVNCPMTSSMGRLFDAASALLGVCCENTFHSQAPMELEARASEAPNEERFYGAVHEGSSDAGVFCAAEIIRGLVEDVRRGTPVPVCAARFHNAIAQFTLTLCEKIRNRSGLSTVALSGGVFANAFLTERLDALLKRNGFEVLLNALVPAGDGGISLGQAAVAAWRRSCA